MKKTYNISIDFLRTLAILAVILVHTTTRTLEASNYNLSGLPVTFFLHELASFAVALFFFISGFLLELHYGKKISYVSYIKKRASKIVIPFLFWSTFYFLVFPQTQMLGRSFIYILLSGKAAYQLYFIPSIVLFYILFPILHSLYAFWAKKFVLMSIIIINIGALGWDYYIHPFPYETAIRITLLYTGIFLLGMVASRHEQALRKFVKKHVLLIGFLTILSASIVYLESKTQYIVTKNIHYFYSQHRPSVFFYTLFLAALFLSYPKTLIIIQKPIMILAKLSYFVFFVHVAVVYFFWYTLGMSLFQKSATNTIETIGFDLFFFFSVTIFSFLLAAIVHKIPKVKLLTG